MRILKSVLPLICLMSLVALPPVAMAAGDFPTLDELRQLQTNKKWSELVSATGKILQLKGEKAKDYDRVEVMTLKAEAQLQLKQFGAASTTFDQVSKEKEATEDQVAIGAATSLLCKKIDAKGYKTPAGKDQPSTVIDVYDPEKRKDAFKAMFDTGYADLKKDVEKNKTNPNFNWMPKDAKLARDLGYIEKAATGKNDQSQDMTKDIDSAAVKIIRDWIDTNTRKIERLRKLSEEQNVEIDPVTHNQIVHRRGLDSNDQRELQDIVNGCKNSNAFFKQMSEALAEPSSALKALPDDIRTLSTHASELQVAQNR